MTHQMNRCNFPAQKAGQGVGAALPLPLLPRILVQVFSEGATSAVPEESPERWALAPEVPAQRDGSDRVAGEEAISKKTSTAALASFRQGPLPTQRRAPRHPCKGFVETAF